MNVHDKLAKNCFQSSPDSPAHIILSKDIDPQTAQILIHGCPAGLYQLDAQGNLKFDHLGCLECGTCRILCDSAVLRIGNILPQALGFYSDMDNGVL